MCWNQGCGRDPFSVEAEARKFHRFRFHIKEKNRGRKDIGSAILRRRANGERAQTLRNESEEELFREMLIPT